MTTKLSPAMEAAMGKLTREWSSAWIGVAAPNTLTALKQQGLAESISDGGCWRLTERGEQWLAS